MFMFGGLLRLIKLPDVAVVAAVDIAVFTVDCMIVSTALLFLFRYSQTVDGWLCRSMADYRKIVPATMALLVLTVLGINVPMHKQLLTYSDLMRDINIHEDDELIGTTKGRNIYGFNVSDGETSCRP